MDKEFLDNLTAAVSNGRTDIVRTLINICENGSSGDDGTNKDRSITCDMLLNDLCTTYGTLLHLSTKLDHVDIVRMLLSAGADPGIENRIGETPYDLVQSEKMSTVFVNELLKSAAESDIDRIHQLITAGVDVNSKDSPESENTALHYAASFGKSDAVQCLLGFRANPNITNAEGATPLHDAVNKKNLEIVKMLLASGSDISVRATEGKYCGKTPLDMIKNDKEIEQLLLDYSITSESNGLETLAEFEESPRSSNDLTESVKSLSITSMESSAKQNLTSYVSQPLRMPLCPSLSSPPPLITDSKLHLLWPQPQQIVQTDGLFFKLQEKFQVHIAHSGATASIHEVKEVWDAHHQHFTLSGITCDVEDVVLSYTNHEGRIVCHVNNQLLSKKGSYKIIVTSEQVRVLSADKEGLHYALSTLGQLFQLYKEDESIPPLYIHDWPLLQQRAVLLDLSQGARKPSMDTLKGYIDIMSRLKISELHLFFRFDFKEETVLPFTSRDLMLISKYCSHNYMSIVPVVDVEATENDELKDLSGIPFEKLMTLFSTNKVHMGPNLSKALLYFLETYPNNTNLWKLLSVPSSTVVMLCSNALQLNKDLLNLLPLNVVFVEYGYQVEHDYDCTVKFLILSGFNVCIGAGTSSWGSIAGSPETALSTVYKASQTASVHKCSGLVIADWKPSPHHTALCFSWPGIVLALGLAWNCSVHIDYLHVRLPELLNYYVFQDAEQVTGYLSIELGRLEAFMHQSIQNHNESSLSQNQRKNSVLHQILIDPDDVALENFTIDLLQQAVRHVKKFELDLQKAKPLCFQQGEVISELRLAMDLLLFSCRMGRVMVSTGLKPTSSFCGLAVINVGIGNLPPTSRTDLANRLLALIEQFRAVWLSRSLPCGLQTSLHIFNQLLCKFIPDSSSEFLDTHQMSLTD